MKILVYETTEIVPIDGLYEWLGDSGSIIFSNADQAIQNFDSKEVIRLLGSINFDTVIFYIPLSIQNQFVKLVNQQFNITEWQEDNTVKFSIDDIRLIGKDVLSRFFEKMRLIVGLSPKKECYDKKLINYEVPNVSKLTIGNKKNMPTPADIKEFTDYLDLVVEDSIGMDGIFVYDVKTSKPLYTSGRDPILGDMPMASFSALRNVGRDMDRVAKEANRGKLQYALFPLTEGMIQVYWDNIGGRIFALGFVGADPEQLGALNVFCDKRLPDIKERLAKVL
ncbi:MAG: hypothetical protein DRR16_05920 [Candidatus Parabeggiatoa sp. nov. 3]|nr:MAG: hypothetical protein DRR00_32605 [Gammaproteobacteria bacterium]RKZ64219.1 MAG: hypothetical protein DRQ99_15850 [Gammaproteobacteria bacterium]RKZ88022.1 MAG: hypothetical protein DRR16_05920 [Gammaproteobacteria bacterium]